MLEGFALGMRAVVAAMADAIQDPRLPEVPAGQYQLRLDDRNMIVRRLKDMA